MMMDNFPTRDLKSLSNFWNLVGLSNFSPINSCSPDLVILLGWTMPKRSLDRKHGRLCRPLMLVFACNRSFEEELQSINQPTLIISGTKDGRQRQEYLRFVKKLPNGKFVWALCVAMGVHQ